MLFGSKKLVWTTRRKDVEKPEPPSNALETKVRWLRKKGMSFLPLGQMSPRKTKVISTQIARDPTVKAWVLETARGKCYLCGNPAPLKDYNEVPFLEVHHVRFLAGGGPDTIWNAVALCPNCHRACHYSSRRKNLV